MHGPRTLLAPTATYGVCECTMSNRPRRTRRHNRATQQRVERTRPAEAMHRHTEIAEGRDERILPRQDVSHLEVEA